MMTTDTLAALSGLDPLAFAPWHPALGFAALLNPAIPKAINLVIFFTILYLLLRKPAREFFTRRYQEIRAGLDRAAKEKAEAEARMRELDARLNRLDADIAEIKEQARREAEAERERIVAAAAADAEKLRLTARREIEAAKQAALIELRRHAAEQAVALAEQAIRRELTPADDARLLERASAAINGAQ
jgi:F-type H+-transporting ATPase subunit b